MSTIQSQMNRLYKVLEICLQELENGGNPENILILYPDLANRLRPILNDYVQMRNSQIPYPSLSAFRRGRVKLFMHVLKMRKAGIARQKRVSSIIQRFAFALILAAMFITSGTRAVDASSSALPGEKLYRVKRMWENTRIFFTMNYDDREILIHRFESERLNEVNELLVEGRRELIHFAGTYMESNSARYVSGIPIVILPSSVLPNEPLLHGKVVGVKGKTNANGFVDVISIELLPEGRIVPLEPPIEIEDAHTNKPNGGNKVNSDDSFDREDRGKKSDNNSDAKHSNGFDKREDSSQHGDKDEGDDSQDD